MPGPPGIKASRPTSALHPRAGGRGSKLPTRSRKSEAVVSCITNTKTATDTHSHTQGHTLTCSQAYTQLHSLAQGRPWALRPSADRPGPARGGGCGGGAWAGVGRGLGPGEALGGAWAGLGGAGVGGAPPDAVQSVQTQEFLMQEQTSGAAQRIGPAGGSVLTLGLPVWKAGVCRNCPSENRPTGRQCLSSACG